MADFKIAIIGAGPGGYVAAIRAAQLGAKVALIEKGELGGTCLNRGCIPSKILLEASGFYARIRKESEAFGITTGAVSFDYSKVAARKEAIIKKLRGGIAALLKKNKVEHIAGKGRLAGPNGVEVDGRQISAEHIIISSGTEPARPAFFPFNGKTVVTSDEMLERDRVPAKAIIIGGGYIGCEFATVLNEFGCEVTLVEMLERLLPISDEMISKEITRAFKKNKINILTGTRIEKVESGASGVRATLAGGKTVEGEMALVSVGRAIVSKELGLESAGIQAGPRGEIAVNEMCQTKVPHIYAIGDVTGQIQLAHLASRHGINAVEHIMGKRTKPHFRVVPSGIFTHPEAASVGLTEAEARKNGREVKVGEFPFQNLGKAMAMEETAGRVKIVADGRTGEVLGVHIVGAHATDLIAEATLAMEHEATAHSIADTIHTHPTLGEAMMEAAEAVEGKAIHT
jgi:dihydrolipoamide dehydrogenase